MLQDGSVPAADAATNGESGSKSDAAASAVTPGMEGVKDAAQNVADTVKDAPPPQWIQFIPFIAIGLFFYFVLLRPQQAEKRRRQEVLNSLKKNDKVVTTSGIIGTIADISSDGSRVTLKVDDNTRIKFLRSAIQEPLKDSTDSAGTGST